MDWKRGLVQVARNMIDKVPEVAQQFAEVREQNRAIANQRAATAANQQYQQQQRQMLPTPQMTTAQQTRGRAAYRQPPPGMSMSPPEQVSMTNAPIGSTGRAASNTPAPVARGVPLSPSMPFSPVQPMAQNPDDKVEPYAQAPPVPTTRPQAPPIVEPFEDPYAAPFDFDEQEPTPAPEPQTHEPEQEPDEDEQAVADPQQAAEEPPALNPEQIIKFASELEDAIKGEIIGPKRFAGSFIQNVGPEATASIITNISAAQFVDGVAQSGGDSSVIVTRDGRKYCEQLWEAAGGAIGVTPKRGE